MSAQTDNLAFWTKFKVFPVEKRQSEHHYRILHI